MHIMKQNFPKIIKKDHATTFILASKDESELRTDKMTVLPQPQPQPQQPTTTTNHNNYNYNYSRSIDGEREIDR